MFQNVARGWFDVFDEEFKSMSNAIPASDAADRTETIAAVHRNVKKVSATDAFNSDEFMLHGGCHRCFE
ncbi:hypothetical protein ES703_105349 [subsurface metagenome]